MPIILPLLLFFRCEVIAGYGLRPLHIPEDLRIRLKTPKLRYFNVCIIDQQNAGVADIFLITLAHL